jgi:hypothetical protein
MKYPLWMESQMAPDGADAPDRRPHWDLHALDVNVADQATSPAERYAALLTLRDWHGARRVVVKRCWGGRSCW